MMGVQGEGKGWKGEGGERGRKGGGRSEKGTPISPPLHIGKV